MKKILHIVLTGALLCCSATESKADQKAYGYLFGSKTDEHGFVSFDTTTPQTLSLVSNRNYGYVHVSAGEYVDGKIYTYRVEFGDITDIYSNSWAVYDANTYKELQNLDKSDDNRVVDMTYDYTTNTMYALVEDHYTTSTIAPTKLCVVDMATGDLTQIGTVPEITAIDGNNKLAEDGLITIACDATGNLYAMSAYRTLYKVDKFTGAVTVAAPQHNLGTAAQFQSMAFDTNGTLWWAQQHPSYGHFCEIDMTTGVPGGFVDFRTDYEKLKKLGDDSQVTALFFKDKQVNATAPAKVTDVTISVSDTDIHAVNLSWTLPTLDYSGNPVTVTGVEIYRIGKSEPVGKLDGTATSFIDTEVPDGTVLYEILPLNTSGHGFPAFAETFAGTDQLTKVTNIALAISGRTTTLTWDKPTYTVNGGYADYNAITYNVYRVKGDLKTAVAKDLDKTEFSETIDEDGGYFYQIEPMCGGIAGQIAESETFVLTSTASIPYSTGFEDDQDGSQWSFINKHGGNTGWSITTDYYAIDGKFAKSYTGGSSQLGDDWLMSPAIQFEAGDHTLTFDANGSSFDKVTLDILLGTDKADVSTFTLTIKSFNNEKVYDTSYHPKGWKHFEVPFTVPSAGVYYLGFHNKTPITYAYCKVDNLSITSSSAGISDITATPDDVVISLAGDYLSVQAPTEIASVDIVDIQGRTVLSAQPDATSAIVETASLESGIYIIAVNLCNGSRATAKAAIR